MLSISITTSRDILEAMARGDRVRGTLWSRSATQAGAPASWSARCSRTPGSAGRPTSRYVFELPPDQRWDAAARLLGVDLHLLSTEAGHA
jgi:putative transcriptional regulator